MPLNDRYFNRRNDRDVLPPQFNGSLVRHLAALVNRVPRVSPVPSMMLALFFWLLAGNPCQVAGQFDFEQLPIDYHRTTSDDSLMELQSRLQSNEIRSH